MAYNHSIHNDHETVLVEPTETTPGRVRALHATKGFRESRIAPLHHKRPPTLAQRFYHHVQTSPRTI